MPKRKKEPEIAYAYAYGVFKVKLILEEQDNGTFIEPTLQLTAFNMVFGLLYYWLKALYYFRWLVQGLLLGKNSTREDYVPLLSRDKENTKKLRDFLSKQK